MSNFLKTLQKDLKKVNVEPKQILKKKKQSDIENERKKAQEIRKKKQWKDLERHENLRGKMKVTPGIKTK